jgi:hypothetical protein
MCDTKTFSCSACNYETTVKGSFNKHVLSKKHDKNTKSPVVLNTKFQCKNCQKHYKGQSGLWGHSKKCVPKVIIQVSSPEIKCNENNTNREIIEAMNIMNEEIKQSMDQQIKQSNEQINRRMDKLSSDLKENQQIVQTINNNSTTINNTFNMTVFLNEKCGEAINFEEFIKRIMFEFANSTLMMESYVEGTCNIIQRNLEQLPVNKRPMHCLIGEDPHQQLLHIRQDNKWNTSSELNWMQQIHADDDDDVVHKNPIYYGLKTIDDKKLEYLAYNLYANESYVKHFSRLRAEINCRPDLKEKVYHNILKMISLDTDKLDEIHKVSKIMM